MIKEILQLGNPALYERSVEITGGDWDSVQVWVTDLHDTLLDYRKKYGAGRAVAAPQIGVKKRLLYMLTDREYVFINPVLEFPDEETYEVMDDCMSFPGLCVKVIRHRRAVIKYLDRDKNQQEMTFSALLSLFFLTIMDSNLEMALGAVFMAGGYGIMCTVAQSASILRVEPENRGLANGTYYIGMNFGMAFGPIIGGILYGKAPLSMYYPILMLLIPICLFLYWGSRTIIDRER